MKALLVSISALILPFTIMAQDDLLNELTKEKAPETVYAIQTFNGTRIVNGQSVETKGEGALEFIFSHRFGLTNSGSYNFWGLDDAFVRLGLEYGITDRLGFGIGRSSTDKTFDGYLRYKVLRQSKGARTFPVTITSMLTGYIQTSPQAKTNPDVSTSDRLAYSLGILIARKFSPKVSAQLTPLFVHRNTVDESVANHDDVALGFGGRFKISRSISLVGEYYYHLNRPSDALTFDAVGMGFDIETGGHVFQLIFTNTLGMFDRSIVSETTEDFFSGDVRFGFNITRTFQVANKK